MKQQCLIALSLFLLLLAACGVRRPPPALPGVGVYHRVRPGQTLFRIAKTYGVGLQELRRVNRIADPAKVRAGDRLFIPRARKVLEVPIYRPAETAALERKLPAE